MAKAKKTADSEPGFVLLNQYGNSANPDSHYRTTGPEIWRQTEGKITHFVAGLGTCGTITGTGRFLKEQRGEIKVIGVYPEDGHDIPGVRSMRQLQHTEFFLPEEYDRTIEVTNRDSFDLCLRLNREESIIAGPSSGMALVGALRTLPDEPGVVAVLIFPDNVFKYASSVQRHFPQICPAAEESDGKGPSKNDQFLSMMVENLKNAHGSVRASELHAQMQGNGSPLVIDVRSPDFYAESHIPGSVNLPMEELPERTGELPEDRNAPIVLVCGIGKFSKNWVLYLKSLGYTNARSMKGGINEWVRKSHPVESGGAHPS